MRVGLALPQYDSSIPGEHPLRWPALARWARTADQLGYQSLWLSDHLFIDTVHFGIEPGRVSPLDALPALAAVARVTARARLGTLVLCTPLRPPTIVAKALATLDVISGGRVIAGLGAGWFEPEFREAGVAFGSSAERLAQLAAAIETMRRTWAGEGPPCRPPPVHPLGPPIWVGGRGERLLQLIGRLADGWHIGWTGTLDDYRQRSAVIDRACEEAGRDPASVTRSVGLHTLVGEDRHDLDRRFERLARLAPPDIRPFATLARWRHGHLVGTIEEVRQQLADWAGAGVTELIVNPGGLPFHAVNIDDLPLIAQACSLET